jgi:acetyl-CoA carboxylase biotin carboxyl carrier protein
MDIKQVHELVKIINKTNIAEISIEEEGLKITIKQKEDPAPQVIAAPAHTTYIPAAPPPVAPPQAPAPAAPKAAEPPAATAENLLTIKSPMIGTFYRSPSPDKPSFVNIGDDVNVGKVVCIVEAMKLFNEIESEVKGRIVKVLVEDASPVEYDQPLFLVEPA